MGDYKLLPFIQPPLLTYHNQACVGVVAMQLKTGIIWYLNNAMQLVLEKKFLDGFTSPLIQIEGARYSDVLAVGYGSLNVRYVHENIVDIIIKMLDNNHYVLFDSADDFYIEGKSWYNKRHFNHDGMIIGYDMSDRTFTVAAYDNDWIFRSFKTPMGCFPEAYRRDERGLTYGTLINMWPMSIENKLDFNKILGDLKRYLDSDYSKYPMINDGEKVYGIIVIEYLAEYLERIRDGRIPQEKKDRRIIRLLLDHKSLMYKRIVELSKELNISNVYEEEYKKLVDMIETMRFQYKKFELRPNMYIIERLIEQLHQLYKEELKILNEFVVEMEEKLCERRDV